MVENIQLRVACRAFIVREGKVLILRKAGSYADGTNEGKWLLPGGRIEIGEEFQAGEC